MTNDAHDHHDHDHDDLPEDVPHSQIHPPDYEVVSMIAARGCRHCGMIVAGTRLFEHRKFHDELDKLGLALNGEVVQVAATLGDPAAAAPGKTKKKSKKGK
jgi:hypothetical protein